MWTDKQTENSTFPHPSDAGGNELTRTFADTYRLVSVSDSIPPSPVSHDHQLASVKKRLDMSAVVAADQLVKRSPHSEIDPLSSVYI